MGTMKSKTSVVGHAMACVKVYDAFIKSLTILKDSELVKSFDGKTINKRHTDKMQTLLPDYIRVELKSEEYQPYLNLTLYYDESKNSDSNIRNYLDYYGRTHSVRQEKACYYNNNVDSTYCLNGVREFNYTNFVKCAEKQIDALEGWIKQYQDVINRIDEVIDKTAELKKHIDEVLATFPSYLKPYVSFSETIYNDVKERQ